MALLLRVRVARATPVRVTRATLVRVVLQELQLGISEVQEGTNARVQNLLGTAVLIPLTPYLQTTLTSKI